MDGRYLFVVATHLLGSALALQIFQFIFPGYSQCFLSFLSFVFSWSILAYATFELTKKFFLFDKIDPLNKAVFITGCDTGFGHRLARRLDSKGFHVFAGCLLPVEKGATDLKKSCSRHLQVVPLDITDNETVKKAYQFVKENLGTCDLWAIVNNAGILTGMSVDLSSVDEFQRNLDVNCMGTIRVTKAFLPLLRKSKGRVVNVTSVVGYAVLPFIAPYNTSKFATAGFTECLRHELQDWDITVSTIEPEIFNTNLSNKNRVDSVMADTISGLDAETMSDYGTEYLQSVVKNKDWFLWFACSNVDLVVNDMESAVTSMYPDARYKPRRNFAMRFLCFLYEAMPYSWQAFIMYIILSVLFKKPKLTSS